MATVLVNLLQTTGTKGGIEIYVRELYKHIAQNPGEFEFIGFASTELYKTDTSWFPGRVLDSGISGENRISWAIGELFAVSKCANHVRADLIHGPAMFGPLSSDVPVVITVHDLLYFSHPELMKNKLLTGPVKWMEKKASKNATRLISISEATRKDIQKYLRFDEELTDTVLSAGRPHERSSFSTPTLSKKFFLAMGQRSPYKSFETLIEAWARMAPHERPRLVITGSHGDDPLRELVEQAKLEDSVELKTWISDEELENLFEGAIALIEPTIAAGFGMPALEAMGRGVPVVISDIPVFREIAGPNCFYFEPQNSEHLRSVVQEVHKNKALREKYSRDGLEWASQFSWHKTAQQSLEAFRKALAN